MKKISLKISILALCVTALSYHSCNDENLELKPLEPTEQDFFDAQEDFERGALGIYAKMTDMYAWNGGVTNNSPSHAIWQLPGDDITTTGSFSASVDFENFRTLTPNNEIARNQYSNAFQIITRANILLQKIASVKEGVYTDTNLKDYHKGEALFLRGYAFFFLWNIYGSAPVITKRIDNVSDAFVGPSSGNALLDQAILDFQDAATLLPTRQVWGATNLGRATRDAANGMLGKALVFRGTVTKSTGDFSAAITAFNNITEASLEANFDDNFAADKENNRESLFEFQAGQDPGENIWLPNDFQPQVKDMSVSCWVPFNNVNNWGYGGAPFIATTKLLNAFETGDPRLSLTLDPVTRKINKYTLRDQTVLGGASSVNNPRILRYADVLLLKAEALLRSGGSKSEAIGLINQVRKRARDMSNTGVPADRDISESSAPVILDWVKSERFVELACEEGSRWFDIRRWNLAGELTLSDSFFSSDNTSFKFDGSKHIFFPIPQVELDRNINMKQNSGY